MSSTTARIGAAVVGNAIIGTSDMPDETQDHFTWEGHCWELVTDPALNVALMDPGAPASAKEALVARQVQSMSVATKKLIVTDEAILNHATLIGQTVVDDINVQGKLIGRDGVFTGTVDFENINVTGTQLVNKLGANSIEANMIKGGSFSGEKFTGGEFNGATIIGGAIATTMYASRDGGVHIGETTGIRAWDTSGKQTFHLSSSTGAMAVAKSITVSDDSAGRGVYIMPKVPGTEATAIYMSSDGKTGSRSAAIVTRFDTDGSEPIEIRGGGGSGVYTNGGVYNEGGPLSTDGDLMARKDVIIQGKLTARGTPTASGSASARFGTSASNKGTIYQVTSSRQFKRNIVNWSPDPERVLSLRPRQWQHDDAASDEIDETWYVGFVAEEVDEAGLYRLVDYRGDGKGGWEPYALNYDRFAAAQQVVLQKHEAEIKELRERIALLEAQIGTK